MPPLPLFASFFCGLGCGLGASDGLKPSRPSVITRLKRRRWLGEHAGTGASVAPPWSCAAMRASRGMTVVTIQVTAASRSTWSSLESCSSGSASVTETLLPERRVARPERWWRMTCERRRGCCWR
eukprot:4917511-Prymnesium_polylepis.1